MGDRSSTVNPAAALRDAAGTADAISGIGDAPVSEQGIESRKKEESQAAVRDGDTTLGPINTDTLIDAFTNGLQVLNEMTPQELQQFLGVNRTVLQDIEQAIVAIEKASDQGAINAWQAIISDYGTSDHDTQVSLAERQMEAGFGALSFMQTVASVLGGIGLAARSFGMNNSMTESWIDLATNFDTEFAQGVSYDRITQAPADLDDRANIQFNPNALGDAAQLRILQERLATAIDAIDGGQGRYAADQDEELERFNPVRGQAADADAALEGGPRPGAGAGF